MHVSIGENIVLVGTAHISKESVIEVKEVIDEYEPNIVAVELCKRRFDVLTNKSDWEKLKFTELLKDNKLYFFLAQAFLASLQRRLGEKEGIQPGQEMLESINIAKKKGIRIEMIDRDISITMKRAWRKMKFIEKFKIIQALMIMPFEESEEIDIKEIMKEDVMTTMIEEVRKFAPSVAEVLIDERDIYLAKKIVEISQNGKVVAVIGAGHLKGVKKWIMKIMRGKKVLTYNELEKIPEKKVNLVKVIGYSIPIIFVLMVVYLIIKGNWKDVIDVFLYWFLINGTLSALGAIIGRGHILSALTAFIAAPFTSLHPGIAAGWFAGLVEAKMGMPTVKDYYDLSKLERVRDFFTTKNRFIRVLMVTALANLGSAIATWIALPYVIRIAFGI